jgi:glucose-6-phosphate isomerase
MVRPYQHDQPAVEEGKVLARQYLGEMPRGGLQ